jgi:hypothetical protein
MRNVVSLGEKSIHIRKDNEKKLEIDRFIWAPSGVCRLCSCYGRPLRAHLGRWPTESERLFSSKGDTETRSVGGSKRHTTDPGEIVLSCRLRLTADYKRYLLRTP